MLIATMLSSQSAVDHTLLAQQRLAVDSVLPARVPVLAMVPVLAAPLVTPSRQPVTALPTAVTQATAPTALLVHRSPLRRSEVG